MLPRASKVNYCSPYKLSVEFTNGERKLFNIQPYLAYPVYEKLTDEAYCANAKVKNGIVIWDDETDIDPDRLYLESSLLPLAQL